MHKRLTLIIAGLTMVGPLAIDTYLPAFPAMGHTFNASPLLIQQTLSLFLFMFAFMMLFSGTLSDSFGRRPIILGSLILHTVAALGAAFAPSFFWLLVARSFQGLASGVGSVVGRAIVRDRVSGAEAQQMLSHIMMIFGLAPALAPIIGGWLHLAWGWRSIFLFLALFSTVMLWVSYRSLPESLPAASRHPFQFNALAKRYWQVICHREFFMLAAANGMAFAGISLYIGSAAQFVMTILKLPETAFGWMFIPMITGMVTGSAIASHYAARFKPRSIINSGYAIMAVAALSNVGYNAFFPPLLPWVVVPLMIYSFGVALTAPAMTMIIFDLFPEQRGLASSLQSFVQMALFAVVSGLVAPLLFDSALKLALGVLTVFTLSLLCWMFCRPASNLT